MINIVTIQVLKEIDSGKIALVPIAINEKGFGSETNIYSELNTDIGADELGKEINKIKYRATQIGIVNVKDEVNVWKIISSAKTRKRFCSQWERVLVYCNQNSDTLYGIPSGLEITASKFDGQDFLGTNYMPKYNLPLDVSDEELGKTILKAFEQIKDIVLKHGGYNFV